MSEPPGLSSALGIEAVEWLPQGADSLTVRVGGRWRRRRPSFTGPPLLVLETGGTRQRFPAMPEPPGLTGAAPGTWQMSFSVPAALANRPGTRAWLQLGSIVVPLPVPVGATEPGVADEETLAQRRIRAAELAAESAAHRAAEAGAQVQRLHETVAELERELERQQQLTRAGETARRSAEQRAHAEQAARIELEELLAADPAGEPADDPTDHQIRIEELEHEVERLRRAVDEADQAARAALAGRRCAEEQLIAARSSARPPAGRLRAELALAQELPPAPAVRFERRSVPEDSSRLRREQELIASHCCAGPSDSGEAEEAVLALRRELDLRSHEEAALRAELAALQGSLRERPDPAPELQSTLATLREELASLREATERETAARRRAELRVDELERELHARSERSELALRAIAAMREQLAELRAAAPPPPAPAPEPPPEPEPEPEQVLEREPGPEPEPEPEQEAPPAGAAARAPVEAERLAAALLRLRESTPVAEPLSVPSPAPTLPASTRAPRASRWLRRPLRRLARRDPDSAARLLGALLAGAPEEARDGVGLLALGPVRRGLRLGFARARGRRERFAAVQQLVRTPTTVTEIRLEPVLAFTLVAAMVEPAWTKGERFTIAHDAGPYLHVRDGSPASVTAEALLVPVTTTVVCAPGLLLAVLSGARGPEVEIRGQGRPLELVQAWLERAQSG